MFDEPLETIIANTIAVITQTPERRGDWRVAIANMQKGVQDQINIDLCTAILAILDGQPFTLPDNHPYAQVVIAIQEGIAADNNFYDDLVEKTAAALGPMAERRREWRDYLLQLRSQADQNGQYELRRLFDAVIGLLDAGGNAAGLGMNLTGMFARVWQKLVRRVSSQ